MEMVDSLTNLDVKAAAEGLPSESASSEADGGERVSARRLVAGMVAVLGGLAVVVVALYWETDRAAIKVPACGLGVVAVLLGLRQIGRHFSGDRFDLAMWLSCTWLVVIVLGAIFADLLPLTEARDPSKVLREPTLQRPDLFSRHPLGTDRQGLDILGQLFYGARVSLVAGLGSTAVGMTIGGLIGILAGFFRGPFEWVVNLLTNTALAFPPLILLLAMVTVFEPNLLNITLALALLVVPTYIRLARANTLLFAKREFVLAARALGATRRRIIFHELFPNVALPVLSLSFVVVALLIVAEASLSFLGLGIQRPTPTWGNMVAAAQGQFNEHPHAVFVPGITLFLTVFALNAFGERVRSRLDPRQASA